MCRCSWGRHVKYGYHMLGQQSSIKTWGRTFQESILYRCRPQGFSLLLYLTTWNCEHLKLSLTYHCAYPSISTYRGLCIIQRRLCILEAQRGSPCGTHLTLDVYISLDLLTLLRHTIRYIVEHGCPCPLLYIYKDTFTFNFLLFKFQKSMMILPL